MADISPVYSTAALNLLKADLGYYDSTIPPAVESHLIDLLDVARQRLCNQCGIVLVEEDLSDTQLVASFAAWLYRSRVTGAAKPEGLKDDIRNRQVNGALKSTQAETEACL
jgi:hypothetical protein